jgi:hypothetical protein
MVSDEMITWAAFVVSTFLGKSMCSFSTVAGERQFKENAFASSDSDTSIQRLDPNACAFACSLS